MTAFPQSISNSNQTFTFPTGLRLATLAAQAAQTGDVCLEDSTYRLFEWNRLKAEAPLGPLHLSEIMDGVELQVFHEKGTLIGNVDELFKRFAEKIRPNFDTTCSPGEVLKVSQVHLTALQTRLQAVENKALEMIWDQRLLGTLTQQGAFAQMAAPVGSTAIRAWLTDAANAARILEIRELDLRDLNLKTLPCEIGFFTGLQILNLSHNELSYLPKTIGNLTDLRILDLSYNQLREIPETIGNLRTLRNLSLSINQLRELPETIGNLTDLRILDLCENCLISLPETIGNLKLLRSLFLDGNQLSVLPELVGKLQALNWLSVSINPLILVSDKGALAIKFNQAYSAHLEEAKQYTPQSPLAMLFRSIGFNQPDEAVQQAYRDLSVEMQKRIVASVEQEAPSFLQALSSSFASGTSSSSASSSSESSIDLFADMGLFARSVRRAAYDLYDSLEQERKDLVHYHIWDLAGRPETDDPNWGAAHVFDHALRFTDALERAIR
ncbi:MAG: leucine-rich repeat domain-containing protein [Parachlamydiales bacterium]|nr:leucine-rich repeat domain-containing protein [Verrucomicrobiota bacterium]